MSCRAGGAEQGGARSARRPRQRVIADDSRDVRYRDLPGGAQITYATTDATLAHAIEAWFEAQLSDHGDDATHSDHQS
jgi:hypothetical protein